MIWVVFAVMTGVAILAFLWPLAGKPRDVARQEIETNLYRDELAGIDRDVERGLMSKADADAARAEAGRRLLASSAVGEKPPASRRGVRFAAVLVIIFVPAMALGLYLDLGAPDYADRPLQARLKAPPEQVDIEVALARIEKHLAEQPDDARGWEIIAGAYERLNRASDAARAYRELLRIEGPSPERLLSYGQALVYGADGKVSGEAEKAFAQVVQGDPDNVQARFFIGLAAEQRGDAGKAIEIYTKLVAEAPADAPWTSMVRERIGKLGGAVPPAAGSPPASEQGAAIAALPAGDREKVSRGMVEGLAARLAADGGSAEEWSRLVRAYTVLREPDKARQTLADARKALSADAAALAELDILARDLGLGG